MTAKWHKVPDSWVLHHHVDGPMPTHDEMYRGYTVGVIHDGEEEYRVAIREDGAMQLTLHGPCSLDEAKTVFSRVVLQEDTIDVIVDEIFTQGFEEELE